MKCKDCGKEGLSRLSQHLALTDCEYPSFTDKELEVIIGTLMGDATLSLDTDSAKNAQYIIKVVKKEYLEWLCGFYPDWFMSNDAIFVSETAEQSYESSGLPDWKKGKKENYSTVYGICSKRHPKMTALKNKWYNGSSKVFPKVNLTPTILKHWYVTDGNIENRTDNSYRVALNSVNESHRPEFICSLFEDAGFECTYDGYSKFRLTHDDSRNFFDYVGKPLPGFKYKWPDRNV